MNKYRRTTGSKTLVLVNCPAEVYPTFVDRSKGESQSFTDKWFLSITNGVGTHGIQAEFVNGRYKPLGWKLINPELSIYVKEDVWAEYSQEPVTLNTKNGKISYTEESGYVVSTDVDFNDVWFMSEREFNENYELITDNQLQTV